MRILSANTAGTQLRGNKLTRMHVRLQHIPDVMSLRCDAGQLGRVIGGRERDELQWHRELLQILCADKQFFKIVSDLAACLTSAIWFFWTMLSSSFKAMPTTYRPGTTGLAA